MRFVYVTALVLLWVTPAPAQEWIDFVSRDDGFRVNFPAQPKVTEHDLHLGVRRDAAGACVRGRTRPGTLLDDRRRLSRHREAADRKVEAVPAICRRALHRRRVRRGRRVRLLEDRHPRRAGLGLVAVHAARREGDPLHVELHRSRRGSSASADEQQRQVADLRRHLHARQPALHLGRHGARRRSGARPLSAVARIRGQGRQRHPLSRLLRQRLSSAATHRSRCGSGTCSTGAAPQGGAR